MIPERYAPMAYAFFRIIFGWVFMVFGLQKFGLLGGEAVELASLQGAAGVIETVGGLLIMVGLLTRPAAFIASGEMAVAYFYVHVSMLGMPPAGPGFPLGLLVPQMNRGVDAALFCAAFLYIAARGAGILSVDAAMGRSSRRL
jgi:putative oxidoreductase